MHKDEKRPLIALPAITVILNHAGFLINGCAVQDVLFLFTSLICHAFLYVTASTVLLHTRSAWSLNIYTHGLPRAGLTICVVIFFRATHVQLGVCFFFLVHGLINMDLWMRFNLQATLSSHNQFTPSCPLISNNVVDESVQEYFTRKCTPWSFFPTIECSVIVSDARVGYFPN